MARLTHWDGEPVDVWLRLWDAPRLEAYDVIGSTNDRAGELARAGGAPFSVVVADEQREGRGRGGRHWHSPPDLGLWISVLLPGGEAQAPHLPLRVGLAVARAVEHAAAGVEALVEWPNDVVVGGRKVAGVLCEGGHGCVVAGIGINVRTPGEGYPVALASRATSLEEVSSARVSRGEVATALTRELRALCGWDEALLPPALHRELERRDALRDRRVRSTQHGPGVARGIAPDGALLLDADDGGRVRVVAGSVRPL